MLSFLNLCFLRAFERLRDVHCVDPKLLLKWNQSVPRYTSYPTAPQFGPISEKVYRQHLSALDAKEKDLSLYLHLPFCRTMCLFCGCSVVLNRNEERQERYLQSLFQEIRRVSHLFTKKKKLSQLHLGGGTPTSLSEEQFERLFSEIKKHFSFLETAEISIEIDPRTVFLDGGKKLQTLKNLGINRVSFGVQDLDPKVQEAVRRRQTEEMTEITYFRARDLHFQGINIDLIYGLPLQTEKSFSLTAEKIAAWKPDRIAFYSYAKVPWIKAHQKAIKEKDLPSTEEKFRLYTRARSIFIKAGYIPIGMDHFSLPEDSITQAYQKGALTRNFQGYSVLLSDDMVGLGMSSIGFIENGYFQNEKDLPNYEKRLEEKGLAVSKGYLLKEDDLLRRRIILKLMCHFEVSSRDASLAHLDPFFEEGFLEKKGDSFIVTERGRPFIRNIASAFDAYLHNGKFSRAI